MTSVYVVSLGNVDDEVLVSIETTLERTFGFETRRMPPGRDPEYAIDLKRRQYSSSMILQELVRRRPREAARLLAVTEKDLFIPMLSFIFGQAQLNGAVAIVSLARLRQEFYSMPANGSLLLSRVAKEVTHELGHTLGLIHCVDIACPMSLSPSIRQVDSKGSEFCESCRSLLKESIGMLRGQTANTTNAEERS